MAATKLQLNWTAVSHNSVPITRVTNVAINQGGNVMTYAGDNDRYPTVATVPMTKPTINVTCSDPAVLMGIAPGTTGSFTATHKDAKLASGGDIVYTLANAVAEAANTSGPFGQYGTATQSYQGISSDGSTNPLSFTRV